MNKNIKQKPSSKVVSTSKKLMGVKRTKESITSLRQAYQKNLLQIERLRKKNTDLNNNLQIERLINKEQSDRLGLFESELKKAETQIALIKDVFLREQEL